MSRPFVASYGGRCAAECGEPIREGDPITDEDGYYVHVDCAGKPEPPARPVCPKCWLVTPCDCEDES